MLLPSVARIKPETQEFPTDTRAKKPAWEFPTVRGGNLRPHRLLLAASVLTCPKLVLISTSVPSASAIIACEAVCAAPA